MLDCGMTGGVMHEIERGILGTCAPILKGAR